MGVGWRYVQAMGWGGGMYRLWGWGVGMYGFIQGEAYRKMNTRNEITITHKIMYLQTSTYKQKPC